MKADVLFQDHEAPRRTGHRDVAVDRAGDALAAKDGSLIEGGVEVTQIDVADGELCDGDRNRNRGGVEDAQGRGKLREGR